MLLVGVIGFNSRFGGVGELRIECCAHVCLKWMQKALVGTEWAIQSIHLCTNRLRNCPSHLVEASFLAL